MRTFRYKNGLAIGNLFILLGACLTFTFHIYSLLTAIQNSKALIENVQFSFYKLTITTTVNVQELHILPLYAVTCILIAYAIGFVISYVKHSMAEGKERESSYKE